MIYICINIYVFFLFSILINNSITKMMLLKSVKDNTEIIDSYLIELRIDLASCALDHVFNCIHEDNTPVLYFISSYYLLFCIFE